MATDGKRQAYRASTCRLSMSSINAFTDTSNVAVTVSRPETPLYQETGLGLTFAPSNGEAEHIMKVFVQEYMTSILHPLAEKIAELDKDVTRNNEDMEREKQTLDRHQDLIAAHEQRFLFANSSMSRLTEDMTQTKKDMSDALDKQVTIGGQMDFWNVTLGRLEGNFKALTESSNDVRRLAEEMDVRLRNTQLAMAEANIKQDSVVDRVSEMRSLHEGLNDRHLQMVAQMQEVRQSDESRGQTLKRHLQEFEKQKKQDQRSISLLDQRTKTMETLFLECNQKVQQHGKTIMDLTSDVKRCVAELGEAYDEQVRESQIQRQESNNSRRKSEQEQDILAMAKARESRQENDKVVTNRVGRIEDIAIQCSKAQAQLKDETLNFIKELQEHVKKNSKEIQDTSYTMETTQKVMMGCEDRILRNEGRLTHSETLTETIRKNQEKLETEIRTVSGTLREATEQAESQKFELGKTNTQLSNVRQENEEIANNMITLSKTCTDLQGSMVKIGNRLELAHDYFNGLNKGFQDTQKRVSSGLDGMIPPKNPARETLQHKLPELPGAGHTPPRSQSACEHHSSLSSPTPR